MEKLIDDLDNLALWKTVRAIITSALQLLRGERPERFLYGAWKRLRQAENKVREQLALMAADGFGTERARPRCEAHGEAKAKPVRKKV